MAAVSVSARLRPVSSGGHAAASIGEGGQLAVPGRVYDGFLSSVVTGSDQAVAYDAIAAPVITSAFFHA